MILTSRHTNLFFVEIIGVGGCLGEGEGVGEVSVCVWGGGGWDSSILRRQKYFGIRLFFH